MVFSIRVPPDDLHRTAGSAIVWGRLWFEFDDDAFPGVGWADAIDPAFLAWLREARTLVAGLPGTAKLDFMDGPYELVFEAGADGMLGARYGERGGKAPRRREIDRAAFIDALSEAITGLVRAYEAQGWDVTELARIQCALPRPWPPSRSEQQA